MRWIALGAIALVVLYVVAKAVDSILYMRLTQGARRPAFRVKVDDLQKLSKALDTHPTERTALGPPPQSRVKRYRPNEY